VAIFVECLSDNNNRTVANVRAAFNKFGGSLGTNGSLTFLFDRKGIFTIPVEEGMDMDEFELEIIDAGAEDIEVEDNMITVTCAMEDFGSIYKKLEEIGVTAESAELQRIPNDTKEIDIESARKVLKLIEVLEDDDDTQNVFHNLEMTRELAEELG
jgi:YebC/PmpR family DNA-binding regulatory protein